MLNFDLSSSHETGSLKPTPVVIELESQEQSANWLALLQLAPELPAPR